jgi:hypothetical protein
MLLLLLPIQGEGVWQSSFGKTQSVQVQREHESKHWNLRVIPALQPQLPMHCSYSLLLDRSSMELFEMCLSTTLMN